MIFVRNRKTIRAIVYDINNDGKAIFLLLLAKKGYYQNPQGGVEDSETDYEAIYAEVYEEAGLSNLQIIPDTKYSIEYDAIRKGEPIHVVLNAYAVRVDSKQEVIIGKSEDEHQDYVWVDYNKSYELLSRYPEQQTVFKEVCKRANIDN